MSSRFAAINEKPLEDGRPDDQTTDRPGDRATNKTGAKLSEVVIRAEAQRVIKRGRLDDRATARPQGKRNHPDYEKVGLYLLSNKRKQAERKWEDEGDGDFSNLIDKLLSTYLGDR